MTYKIIVSLLTILLVSFVLSSCGSSRQDDGISSESEDPAKQQELDEIEALLGITAEEKSQSQPTQKPAKGKEDDQLGLLSAGAVPVEESIPASSSAGIVQADEKEVKDLKDQIDKKDRLINDLKSQVRTQSDQIYQLETQKQTQPARSVSVAVGDISPEEYESTYNQGLELFHGNQYRDAIQVFESLLASSVNHSLADNAQFWIGESHYALREYKTAVIDFEKVFTFPKSNKNDAAQFKLGLCYVRLGDTAKAREEFQRLLDVYPKSEFTSRAQEHLQTM